MGDAIAWWLTLEILGLTAWPLAWIAMRRLPDRGWAFSKMLGLLLVGYAAWMIGMFQIAPFSRPSNIFMLLVLVGLSAWLVLRNGKALGNEMLSFLRGQARYWIFAELLFGVAFGFWAIARGHSPYILGTEKYMDFGFLNSFTLNQVMPPLDPWLAGYSINYYYFGYTLMGTLCHLSGVNSSVGFNLANVTLFSLTALGAFGLVYNMVAGLLRARRGTVPTRAVMAARPTVAPRTASPRSRMEVAAPLPVGETSAALPTRRVVPAVGVAVAEVEVPAPAKSETPNGRGNGYDQETRPRSGPKQPSSAEPSAASQAPESQPSVPWGALLAGVLAAILIAVSGNMAGAAQVLNNKQSGIKWGDAFDWWSPSRVIVDVGAPNNGQTINEFPFFSFLLNDMHPHMLALPLVMLTLGLALGLLKVGALRPTDAAGALARRRGLLSGGLEGRLRLFICALATGSLFIANTWDYPTYLGIVLACLALPILGTPAARWALSPAKFPDAVDSDKSPKVTLVQRIVGLRETRLGSWVTQAAALVALGLVLFLPFQLTFTSLVGGHQVQLPESVSKIPILGFLASKFSNFLGVNIWPKTWQGFVTVFGFFLYAVIALAVVMLARGVIADRAEGRRNPTPLIVLIGVVGASLVGALLFSFPLMALLPPLAAVAVYLIRERLQPGRWATEELFALVLIAVGAALTFGTEIFYLQDVFGSRLNTLFKFYYQVWIIWGAAAGFGAWWLLAWAFGRRTVPGRESSGPPAMAVGGIWALGFAALFCLAMIYPVFGMAARDSGFVLPGVEVGNPAAHKLKGLDGVAPLADSAPGDLAAIRWVRDNVKGGAGVAEAVLGVEYNVQGNHGRVSAYTGQPTILGWPGHEDQWRGGQPNVMAELGPRGKDQDDLYATTDVNLAKQILTKYNIHYVFVGTIEKGEQGRAAGDTGPWKYSPEALSKFARFMEPVFSQGGTVVYKLPEAAAPTGKGIGPSP